jgi:hypothetical protein
LYSSALRASRPLPRRGSDITFFSFGRRYSAQSSPQFLVFLRIWIFIHPESPCHPVLGDSGREKSGEGAALSAREHANPTFSSQIPLPSLLCCRRYHPSPIRRPVDCTPPSLLPPAYIPPSGMPSAYIPPSGNSSRRASSTRLAGVLLFD